MTTLRADGLCDVDFRLCGRSDALSRTLWLLGLGALVGRVTHSIGPGVRYLCSGRIKAIGQVTIFVIDDINASARERYEQSMRAAEGET